MTIEEFESITEGTKVVHLKHGTTYNVRDKHILAKNPTTGEWINSVTYVPEYPNEEKLFCREKQSFIKEFVLE